MPRRVEVKPTLHTASEHLRASERVASFAVRYTQFLDANGSLRAELPSFAADPQVLVRLYKNMVLTRFFDRKAVALQRTGQLGTYPSSLGQEATTISVGAAMAREELNIVEVKKEPYALKFTGLDGKEVDFAQLRGKVVALYFWSTTNKASTDRIEPLKQLLSTYKKRGFEIVSVCYDKAEDRAKVEIEVTAVVPDPA